MKQVILLIFLIYANITFGQVTNEGKPKSWEMGNQFSSIQAIKLSAFDEKSLLAEDEINDRTGDKPWRFGKKIGSM